MNLATHHKAAIVDAALGLHGVKPIRLGGGGPRKTATIQLSSRNEISTGAGGNAAVIFPGTANGQLYLAPTFTATNIYPLTAVGSATDWGTDMDTYSDAMRVTGARVRVIPTTDSDSNSGYWVVNLADPGASLTIANLPSTLSDEALHTYVIDNKREFTVTLSPARENYADFFDAEAGDMGWQCACLYFTGGTASASLCLMEFEVDVEYYPKVAYHEVIPVSAATKHDELVHEIVKNAHAHLAITDGHVTKGPAGHQNAIAQGASQAIVPYNAAFAESQKAKVDKAISKVTSSVLGKVENFGASVLGKVGKTAERYLPFLAEFL